MGKSPVERSRPETPVPTDGSWVFTLLLFWSYENLWVRLQQGRANPQWRGGTAIRTWDRSVAHNYGQSDGGGSGSPVTSASASPS